MKVGDRAGERVPAAPRPAAATRAVEVGIVVAVGFVVPLVVASHYGALGVPRSDDWSYLVTLFRWLDEGRLAFNHWVSMTLLGQLVLTAPVVAVFGRSVWVAQVWSAVVGTLGLLAVLALGRRAGIVGRGALLVVVCVAVCPLWGPIATTYMTDGPGFALGAIALATAARALTGGRDARWLGAALALGVLTFSVRQYGLVVVLAIATVAWLAADDPRERRRAVVGGAVALVACAVVLALWAAVPDPLTVAPEVPSGGSLSTAFLTLAGFLRIAGLVLAPVLVWVGPVRAVRGALASAPRLAPVLAVATGVLLVVTGVRSPGRVFVGNYLDRVGTLADDVAAGHRAPVIPPWLYDALVVAASVVAVGLVVVAAGAAAARLADWRAGDRTVRNPAVALCAWTTVGLLGAYEIAVLVELPMFDRYALGALPLAGVLLARTRADVAVAHVQGPEPARLAGVAAALGLLAVIGFAFASDSASFDATRWSVATRATAEGYRPLQVYGGFEWLGWHRRVGPPRSDIAAIRRRDRVGYFRHLCVNVVVDPPPALRRQALVRDEIRGGLRAPTPIVAVRVDRPC